MCKYLMLAVLLLCPLLLFGQAQPPVAYQPQLITYNGAPFGPCDIYQFALNAVNGSYYNCVSRTWTLVTGGVQSGSSNPAVCTVGSLFSNTSTNPPVLYVCGAGNTWTQVGGGGLSGMTAGQIPKAATANTVTSSIPLQGTDTSILSSGTVSGTGASLCTDSNGGATTTGCSSGLSQVSSLPATCTPGTTAPVQLTVAPFGVYWCSAPNTWTLIGLAFSTHEYNPCSGVYGGFCDTHFTWDATASTTSPHVTITANDSPFQCPGASYPCSTAGIGSDVGKSMACISAGSSLTGTSTQPTITNVLSATTANLSAAPSGNAGSVACAWGHPDDTGAQAAATAWANDPQGGRFLLPPGPLWLSANPLQVVPAWNTFTCQPADGAINCGQVTGTGLKTSVVFMAPNYKLTNAAGGCAWSNLNASCFFGSSNTQYTDFEISSLGFQFASTSASGLAMGAGSSAIRFAAVLGPTNGNWAGYTLNGQQDYCIGCFAEGFGASGQGIVISGTNALTIDNYSDHGLSDTVSASQWMDMGSVIGDTGYYGMLISSRAHLINTYLQPNSGSASCAIGVNATTDLILDGAYVDGSTPANNGGVCWGANGGQIMAINHTIIKGGTGGGAVNNVNGSYPTAVFIDDGTTTYTNFIGTKFNGSYTKIAGNQISGACTGTATSSSTLGLYGTGPNVTATTCTSTTVGSGIVMRAPGTMSYLGVTASHAGVNASSGVVTVLKNGSGTAMTCTVGTGTACQNASGTSFSYVAGDLISINFTTQGSEVLAGVIASVN